ncbi:CerR family C-terminal domain-containing protein [Phenylobacterium sp.]|uniref:CerR family C-terminal domain-containing protein n=1 Tax=Phenylobacterium sp. TaxID=1871053 RepID=UPI0008D1FD2A|nr:MAG: hypothetical protein A2882_14930 [Phenylobacterium sp. RIFCSPHIGHO2_01_FULL_70_10]
MAEAHAIEAPPRRAGYAKGEETRAAVIAAALSEFGARGYAGATTRKIAEAAGVTLPVIAYHFGGKEGLYRACAQDIVARYYEHAGPVAFQAEQAVRAGASPEDCRACLRQVLRMLLRVFAGADEAQARGAFVEREIRERGPAFRLLYEGLWKPGADLVARLIAGAQDRDAATADDRAAALMLISSLLAFHAGRDVSLSILGWAELDAAALSRLDLVIDRLVAGVCTRV